MSLISAGSISLDSTFKRSTDTGYGGPVRQRGLSSRPARLGIDSWATFTKTGAEPVFVDLLRSPGGNYQPGGTVRQTYLWYLPARRQRLAESISRNQFLGSINVDKYGLGSTTQVAESIPGLLKSLRFFGLLSDSIASWKEPKLYWSSAVLRIRDLVPFRPLNPGSRMGTNQDPHPGSYFRELRNNFLK